MSMKNLKLFKFDGTITNLIHVKGPLNDMSIILSIINAIEKENKKDEFFTLSRLLVITIQLDGKLKLINLKLNLVKMFQALNLNL